MFTNVGLVCGAAGVNHYDKPYENWIGYIGACSTYGSFSYLKYGPMRLFSQTVQDRQIKLGKVIWIAGHSGPETVEDTGADVIGAVSDDDALNVQLEERGEAVWFAPDLVELLDHAPGTEIRMAGVDKTWTRTEDGEWHEESLTEEKKPWWKFR